MKKKIATGSTVAVAVVAIVVATLYPKDFNGKVDCIHQAQVGELIILEASPASTYQWQVLPDNGNYKITNNGKVLIFSAQEVGEYIFICAMAQKNDVKLIVHKVIVTKFTINLKSLVRRWLPQENNNETIKQLARAFRDSAKDAIDIEDLISKTSENNREALGSDLEKYKPFLMAFADYCKTNLSGASFDEHVTVWLEVSKALKESV